MHACHGCRSGFAGRGSPLARATARNTLASVPTQDAVLGRLLEADLPSARHPQPAHVDGNRRGSDDGIAVECPPETAGIDLEHVADVLEREQPAALPAFDPALGVAKEQALAVSFEIDLYGVGEHGRHEP